MIEGLGSFNPQSIQQARENRFNTVDTDSSGGLSQDELQNSIDTNGHGVKLLENFDQIDSDGDGQLTQAKLQTTHQNARANRFERADLDGSGGLDADELQSVYDKTGRGSTLIDNFGAIDENGDGELSADEISAYRDINTLPR